jgi:hypothetical protein
MKDKIKEELIKLVDECHDLELLDLIFRLLKTLQ